MSFEGVVDATARVIATASGIRVVYASTAGNQGTTVHPIPDDIVVTPVAIVRHDGFELMPGSFEKVRHRVGVDLYFNASSAAAAEKAMYPAVTACLAAFRTKVGLYGEGTLAVIRSGGPSRSEEVNGKPMLVYPLNVEVLEASVQTYSLA